MAKIYQYQIATDEFTSYRVREPHYGSESVRITELCTIDGITYISVPDGLELPEQPEQVSLAIIDPIGDILAKIKAISPHVQLINERVVDKIRQRYSMEDEIKFLRTAPSDEAAAYNDFIEECRAWGRAEKTKLGL